MIRNLRCHCGGVKSFKNGAVIMTATQARNGASSRASEQASTQPMSLPVQPLESTLAKFLKSVKPLLSSNEFDNTRRVVEKFSKQEGPKLQALLEAKAKETPNWLEEWWLNTAYLEYRDPVVLFSSPGLVWPSQPFSNDNERLQYTASLIYAALSFNKMLDLRSIPQEMSGKSPLDMAQYYKVFGTSRIPLSQRDGLLHQDPTCLPDNIIVMVNNNVFSLKVLDDSREPLPAGSILSMLEQVMREGVQPGAPVGLLTSENRDRWARAYALLLRSDGNLQAIKEIDRALFAVCLDPPLPKKNSRSQYCHTSELLLHGNGSQSGNAANRWFDKTIQFVIGAGADGVGVTYEHSPAEGNPVGVMADFVLDRLRKRENVQPIQNYPKPTKLQFKLTPDVNTAIRQASANIDKLAADLDVFSFKFDAFGKNQLKALKTSPDSFIQIAIQYAFFKVHNKPAAQYESGTLRKYVGGRTDVIRTCSEESLAFCQSKGDLRNRAPALRAALNAHKNYANDAISAKGVDRHLLGLKLIAKENGLAIPAFYSDAGFTKSTYFQLSTSNVPTRDDGFMVYAPLVQDGYACCYNPRDLDINFGTSAWKYSTFTDIVKFQAALSQSLLEMKDILASVQSQTSKL